MIGLPLLRSLGGATTAAEGPTLREVLRPDSHAYVDPGRDITVNAENAYDDDVTTHDTVVSTNEYLYVGDVWPEDSGGWDTPSHQADYTALTLVVKLSTSGFDSTVTWAIEYTVDSGSNWLTMQAAGSTNVTETEYTQSISSPTSQTIDDIQVRVVTAYNGGPRPETTIERYDVRLEGTYVGDGSETPDAPTVEASDGGTGDSMVVSAVTHPYATVDIYYSTLANGVWTKHGTSISGPSGSVTITGLTADTRYYVVGIARFGNGPPSDPSALVSVYIVPSSAGGARGIYRHFWFDWEHGSFFPVELQDDHEPFCLMEYVTKDGNESVVLHGCRDGYIRRYLPSAQADDGLPIRNHVVIGPFQIGGEEGDGIVLSVTGFLADDSGDVTCELLVGDTCEEAAKADTVASFTFTEGINSTWRPRVRCGAYALKLSGTENTVSWALEKIVLELRSAGRRRKR